MNICLKVKQSIVGFLGLNNVKNYVIVWWITNALNPIRTEMFLKNILHLQFQTVQSAFMVDGRMQNK